MTHVRWSNDEDDNKEEDKFNFVGTISHQVWNSSDNTSSNGEEVERDKDEQEITSNNVEVARNTRTVILFDKDSNTETVQDDSAAYTSLIKKFHQYIDNYAMTIGGETRACTRTICEFDKDSNQDNKDKGGKGKGISNLHVLEEDVNELAAHVVHAIGLVPRHSPNTQALARFHPSPGVAIDHNHVLPQMVHDIMLHMSRNMYSEDADLFLSPGSYSNKDTVSENNSTPIDLPPCMRNYPTKTKSGEGRGELTELHGQVNIHRGEDSDSSIDKEDGVHFVGMLSDKDWDKFGSDDEMGDKEQAVSAMGFGYQTPQIVQTLPSDGKSMFLIDSRAICYVTNNINDLINCHPDKTRITIAESLVC